jgi:aminomethyltransferase
MKRTPLYEAHKALGAKMTDFGGWEMPIQYTSIIKEHNETREKAGLFDVSHMGEIRVKGAGARDCLNRVVTNDTNLLAPRKIIYSPLPNDEGGLVDDLLLYMIGDDEILLVVNASNTDKDYEWLKTRIAALASGVSVVNESDRWAQVALQGPRAVAILSKLTGCDVAAMRYYTFDTASVIGHDMLVSRTGYTGEDGFEIYCDPRDARALWDTIIKEGDEFGVVPVGLGARDTLRFEAGMPLYGHELSDDISPVEAGLGFFVKPDKGVRFPGCDRVAKEKREGPARMRVGIELIERGIPRERCRVEQDGGDIGVVTSGTHSPTFKKGLAMALVDAAHAGIGGAVDVVIREKRVKGRIVKLPFYDKKSGK